MSEWVKGALEFSGMSQASLGEAMARATGTPHDRSRVNKMVLGRRGVTAEEMLLIAEITKFPLPGSGNDLPVLGTIHEGCRVTLDAERELGRATIRVALDGPDLFALRVESDSLGPMAESGSLVISRWRKSVGVRTEDIGHSCIVTLLDGSARIAHIRRGSEPGLFNLTALSQRCENVWDAHLILAFRVIVVLPPDLVSFTPAPAASRM